MLPGERDCGTCENFCGAVVKPSDAGEHTSQLRAELLAVLPAAFGGDNRLSDGPAQPALLGRADLPRLPRPSSDFPLLI